MSNQYNDLLVADMAARPWRDAGRREEHAGSIQLVAAGDAAARDEMIVGNMPLAVAKVESFIRCFPEVSPSSRRSDQRRFRRTDQGREQDGGRQRPAQKACNRSR